MKPLVSILIPAYNAARWAAEAVESAIAQTWARREVIVVDDGSTDGTLAILKRYSSEAVKIVSQENQGAAAARNRLLALSQGDYIQWLDADDILAADKISRQMEIAAQFPSKHTLISGAWGSFYYRTSAATFNPTPLWHDLSPVEWLVKAWEHNAHMQTATWLVSRTLTESAGPWDVRLLSNDDGEYFCRVIRASDGIKFVREAEVFYRVTAASRLSDIGQSSAKLEAFLLGLQLQMQHMLCVDDSERTRAASLQKLQMALLHFYPERPDLVKQVKEMATSLGGKMKVPEIGWKYAWIRKAFGWNAAKKFRIWYRSRKSSIIQAWDGLLFYVGQRASHLKRLIHD
jgi:glycosyltransferase involved in cell wall biosynthesis